MISIKQILFFSVFFLGKFCCGSALEKKFTFTDYLSFAKQYEIENKLPYSLSMEFSYAKEKTAQGCEKILLDHQILNEFKTQMINASLQERFKKKSK